MKPSIQTLGQILYSPSQYVIPVFQRNYRWDRAQWQKLWTSITDLGSPTKTGNHFMGFLVFVPGLAQPGQHTRFHMVDGQQRLTTSSIVLVALRNVARDVGQAELADEINDMYLVHGRKKGDEHFRLLPKAKDQKNYVAIVTGKGEPAGRMADALDYFEGRFKEKAEADADSLRALFNLVCQRLEFMCATLEAENAYNIFKSLNSTGVPLGPSDLIRNFVFMHVKPDDQDEFDADRWAPLEARFTAEDGRLDEEAFSRFFRDVLMMDGRYVQPKETFTTFEARYEATGFSPQALTDSLLANARHYAIIAGKQADQSTDVTTALVGLNDLESSTTYPLLLAMFKKRAGGVIDSAALARSISMLRGFIIRRFICSESSRGYGQMFVRAIDTAAANPLQALEIYLLQRGWPDDARFESSFSSFPLYQRGYTKTVLETIERERGHKEPAALQAAQVEHIMPQTLNGGWLADLGADATRIHAEWLHRPGNLTLSAYNQELWNHPFGVKRQEYVNSNIVITRELSTRTTWGEAEIKERGEGLAHEAAGIWIGPKEPYVQPKEKVAAGAPAEDGSAFRLRFWNGLIDFLAQEHPDLQQFDSRAAMTIRLQSGVRHIGFELRHLLRPAGVALDVYFWREASVPVWEALQANPADVNTLIGADWAFGQNEDSKLRWMNIKLSMASSDETEWPAAFAWFGDKLALLYNSVAPKLREEMAADTPA
jgi:uncharacterized protein with ParB-like and HNH nuclease domain